MKTKSVLFIILLACSIQLSAQNKYEKTYDLKYDLEKAASFTLHNNHYYVNYMVLDGEKTNPRLTSGYIDMKYSVIDKSKDALTFEVNYLDKHNENCMNTQVTTMNYDNVKSRKVKYDFSPSGKVSNFKNIDIELLESNPRLLMQLEEEIIHMLPTLPDNPVKIGDQWEASFGNDNDNFEDFSLVYTLLDEVEIDGHKCVKIIANYQTSNTREIPQGETSLKMVSQDTGHDIYFFAYEKGMLLSRESIGSGSRKIYQENGELFRDIANDLLYETNIDFD